jgi:putative SOS response-associated peptidase YedK
MDVRDSRVHNYPPRWNAAPGLDLLVIRRNHETGELSLDPLRWGLIPHWCEDPKGGRRPINAKCETVHALPMFLDAYHRRHCIVPVDGFFEWKAVKGQKAKQPYAIAMKDGSPFGIGGLWESWKEPSSGQWIRTLPVGTTDANELVARIAGQDRSRHSLQRRSGCTILTRYPGLRSMRGKRWCKSRPWNFAAALRG